MLPGCSASQQTACNAGDLGLIPESERSPGEESDHPLQYSCLENPTDRGAWWATVHGVTNSQTRLSINTLHTNQNKVKVAVIEERVAFRLRKIARYTDGYFFKINVSPPEVYKFKSAFTYSITSK